jgi:hypothetical protein
VIDPGIFEETGGAPPTLTPSPSSPGCGFPVVPNALPKSPRPSSPDKSSAPKRSVKFSIFKNVAFKELCKEHYSSIKGCHSGPLGSKYCVSPDHLTTFPICPKTYFSRRL